MKGRDTLVEYTSEEDEKIKVVSGRVVRKGEHNVSYGIFSTRIYVNGRLEQEYFGRGEGLNLSDVPLVRPLLENLRDGRFSGEELIASLDTFVANLHEQEEIRVDDPERFLEYE